MVRDYVWGTTRGRNVSRLVCHRRGLSTGEISRYRHDAFGDHSYTDLDFADDVCLLAELLELLVPVLEALATEAASLWLEVNWQKTMLQTLGNIQDVLPSVTMLEQEVSTVEEFVYLGALIRSQLSRHPQTECIHAYSDAKP